MKKSKLLIPALSIASVGAVVTPMVTSCKSNDADVVVLSFQAIKGGESQDYEPMEPAEARDPYTKPASATYLTSAMTQGYVSDVIKNPKILADDIMNLLVPMAVSQLKDFENVTISIKNISVKNILTSSGESITPLTFTIIIDCTDKKQSEHTEVKLVNVPLRMVTASGSPTLSYIDPTMFIKAFDEWKAGKPTEAEYVTIQKQLGILKSFNGSYSIKDKWIQDNKVMTDVNWIVQDMDATMGYMYTLDSKTLPIYASFLFAPVESNYFKNQTEA